ncbi:MAG: STAS domain-containing protein, partial [Candidatus Zixiibacteriota bacterium]
MAKVSISLADNDKSEVSEVRVDGIVDTNTAGELEETIESLLARQRYRIILDLAGVEYISSAGWGAIISRIRDIRGNKGDILLSGMVANVREVFELLEFDNVLKNFKSLDDARSEFGMAVSKNSLKKKETEISRLEVLETTESTNGSGPAVHSSLGSPENHTSRTAVESI